MDDMSFQSLQALMAEYYAKVEASKEKDPKKNALFQEILAQMKVMEEGVASVRLYEENLALDFVSLWNRLGFDRKLEGYIAQFHVRLGATTDREKLFQLEIRSLDKQDIDNESLSGDLKKDGERLGHLLAINGDNPNIGDLIHYMTLYPFDIPLVTAVKTSDYFQEDYWKRLRNYYHDVLYKLQWACHGYLAAQKLHFLRSIQHHSSVTDDAPSGSSGTPGTLTLKQDVLLLHRIGFFELEPVKNLTTQNQGRLVGRLFGKNEKNAEDLIRNRQGKNLEKKVSLEGKEVVGIVDALFTELKMKL